ncbi:hypothetical protein ACFWN1_04305 [Streptomyces sp. NPDC058459]|uniref:hypothetical protein n=1 Tax=Streptomyces sp. NPDC058459 TaxID=3346508 RepID=UPI00364B6AB9
MSNDRQLCGGPYGEASECGDPAVFEVRRHNRPSLPVCPLHLGPSLLMGSGVLWPPEISLVARP